jgi:hypothetical protein
MWIRDTGCYICVTDEYTGTPLARTMATCSYIPRNIGSYVTRLTEEYIGFLYNLSFGCLLGWGANKIGHITENYATQQQYIVFT